MADQINTTSTPAERSGGSAMPFIVGILVAAVVVLGYVLFTGGEVAPASDDINITVEGAGSAVEGAAQAVEDGAEAVAGEGN